jgi:hypothetical protein
MDQNGAVVPAAKVTLNGLSGPVKTATTDASGGYSFTGLPPGDYAVTASAPSLTLLEPVKITLNSGVRTLNLQLSVVLAEQKMAVQGNKEPRVSTDSGNNASALVLRDNDLKALGDSAEDLQADLLALAGPSAGPGGAAIFIDGFSGGQLPSKESIREIRINQNPFSPEYDKLGLGRIDILTRPGTDKFRGSVFYNFAHHFWNSRNPAGSQRHQRNALPTHSRQRRNDRKYSRPRDSGSGLIQRWWGAGRTFIQWAEQLRISELHVRRAEIALLEVRRQTARRYRRQYVAAEFRRDVHLRRRRCALTGFQ